jgi:deoxyribodipyrimidine photo-lyase
VRACSAGLAQEAPWDVAWGMPHAALTPPGVHPDRVRVLADGPPRATGAVVLWMQQAQRARANPALAHALAIGALLDRPVAVVVGLTPAYPEATARAYAFMLEGLSEVRERLARRGIGFALGLGEPPDVALAAARGAAVLVVDRGYLRHQRAWRARVAAEAPCPVVQVEGDAVVPVDVASGKAEFAARTLRPKLWRVLADYLDPVPDAEPTVPWRGGPPAVAPFADVAAALADPVGLRARLGVDERVAPVSAMFPGGEGAAAERLRRLVDHVLPGYADDRNQPQRDGVSYLGMHLHFGQVSPVEVLRRVQAAADAAREGAGRTGSGREAGGVERGAEGFVEELLVRRELALNHVERCDDYGAYASLPPWARRTLALHATDPREHVYDDDALLDGATHDPYWNAAMREMRVTGYQHNYMRMYWGKKVLEWSASPEQAYERLLRWNNRFLLDGRDPNSYAGVGWVFGLHDRPWAERPVFGTVRFMNAAGLRRKADPESYVRKVEARVAALRGVAG